MFFLLKNDPFNNYFKGSYSLLGSVLTVPRGSKNTGILLTLLEV